MGAVCTRFPPEASGYLHIGHAKAALLNYHYRNAFEGKLQMRFDDTNPDKENEEFEKIILEDMKLLNIKYDAFSFTSDHFPAMLEMAKQMIKDGNAYCDDTDKETLQYEKLNKIAGKNRDNSVEKNMKMFEGMIAGTEQGQKSVLRAKMFIESDNGALRDPIMYRFKDAPHPRHGNKYKIYPTYDFACPIVDSVEGITHALRTSEYLDRDEQYYWFIEKLGLRKPNIKSYSRLNLNNTVLSKRKLTWFVNEGIVDGWDDARMPTVRGIIRQGLTIDGLVDFIKAQGDSIRIVNMSWDKIWAFNKKIIDPITKRFTAVDQTDKIVVNLTSKNNSDFSVRDEPAHPKNEALGSKKVYPSKQVYVEKDDAQDFVENENVTFINWGNIMIKKVNKDAKTGQVISIDAEPNLADKDFKKTLKVTWVPVENQHLCPVKAVHFENLITKEKLEPEDKFDDYVNRDSRHEYNLLGNSDLKSLKVGDMIQLQRRGYYRVDVAYNPYNPLTCKEEPIVVYYIPDGNSNNPAGIPKFGKPKKGEKKTAPSKPEKKGGKKTASDSVVWVG